MTHHTPDSGRAPGTPDAAGPAEVATDCCLPKGDTFGQPAQTSETLGKIDDACTEAEHVAKDIVALTEVV